MCEDRVADRARPHTQGGGELRRLRVTREMLPQAALVDVVLPAHRARVGGRAALGCDGQRQAEV